MFKFRLKAPAIPEKRIKELLLFQEKAGIKLKNLDLLNNAFIHSSYVNESKRNDMSDNENLEFLGDSVLSLSVSDYLYKNMTGDEGTYTRIRSVVVSEEGLAKIATQLELDKYLIMGKGEDLTGGRHKKAILADCTEAVFAAIYLDRGFEYARDFILKYTLPYIQEVLQNDLSRDYKTKLQEYVQKKYRIVPEYILEKTEGPDHDQVFWYKVTFNGKTFGPASGHNKKEAERNVAKLACEALPV